MDAGTQVEELVTKHSAGTWRACHARQPAVAPPTSALPLFDPLRSQKAELEEQQEAQRSQRIVPHPPYFTYRVPSVSWLCACVRIHIQAAGCVEQHIGSGATAAEGDPISHELEVRVVIAGVDGLQEV